ncbi:hypothetical protein FF1_000791 [Malus domestica]
MQDMALRLVELSWRFHPSLVALGSCRGVVCLANDHFIILWNPLNRSYITVPNTRLTATTTYLGIPNSPMTLFFIKVEVQSQGKGNQQLVDVFEPRRKVWTSFAASMNFSFKILEKVGSFWE